MNKLQKIRFKRAFLILTILISCAVLGYYGYTFYKRLQRTEANLTAASERVSDLDSLLSQSEYDKSELSDALYATQTKLSQYEGVILDLTKRVGTYQKLQTLDPELLQKYSKVYFLNEHYVPSSLVTIEQKYAFDSHKTMQFQSDAYSFLKEMLDSAADEGLGLRVASAYRSFSTQASLKAGYTIQYGSGANRFSADQGYSEHQLGTTVDLTTLKTGDLSTKFDSTPEFAWLINNAYRFGFTLSYPKNNKYYMYEPWHWRFVGIALATRLHDQNQHLYDLDQRDIDEYLLDIFNHV